MDFKSLSFDELINYCKLNNIDHQTKQKKNKSHKTLLKDLIALYKDKSIEIPIDNSNNLDGIIRQCHNYLYRSSAIVGSKAQNDIMRILILRIINVLVGTKNPYILELIENYKNTNLIFQDFKESYNNNLDNIKIEKIKIKIQQHLNYIDYLNDITKILEYKGNDLYEEFKEFILNCISQIFNNIYSKDDYIFNTPNKNDILELIRIISKINISSDFIDNFAQLNGDIHEMFLKYQGNVISKELGQFFTPRIVIDKIINDCGFKELIDSLEGNNLSLFDPCMGTGGVLLYTYNSCKNKINSNLIYACDVEKDTIKMGIASLIITTNKYNSNIIRCNSLTENPYLFNNTKFDVIFTNPPFGTKNNYKELKEYFKDKEDLFKEIYPINTNKGTNLFIQSIIYQLKDNGLACIILPDGEIMTGKSNLNIRKFILDRCKIHKIIDIQGGTFTNTGIKTKALILQKGNYDNYNQDIEYLEITEKEVKIIGIQKLNDDYQFNFQKEEIKIIYNHSIEIKKLGDICEDISTSKNIPSSEKINGNYKFFSCSRDISYHNNYFYEGSYLIRGSRGSTIMESLFITNNEKFAIGTSMIISKIINDNYYNLKYIYYYFKLNKYILNYAITGSAIPMINKENYYNLEIPIPSIEKQNKIVEYLDLLENINKINKDKIENLKKTNEIYLNSILSFDKDIKNKNLNELFKLNGSGKTNSSDISNTGEYPFYKASLNNPSGTHINYDFDGLEYLLFIKSGGCASNPISLNYGIGKVFLVNGKCASNIAVFQLLPISENSIKYLYYYLLNIQTKIQTLANYCVNNGNIDMNEFMNLEIPIPSLEKQNKIVEYLDLNNENIKILEKEIEFNKKQSEEFIKNAFI